MRLKCPNCGTEVIKPRKIWRYGPFTVHAYLCGCGSKFQEYLKNEKHSFTLKLQKGKGYRKA